MKVKVAEKKLETATKEFEDEGKKLKQQVEDLQAQLEKEQKYGQIYAFSLRLCVLLCGSAHPSSCVSFMLLCTIIILL